MGFKAILLVHKGSPSSENEMKDFLFRMYNDPHITPYPKLVRKTLASIISRTTYKKSWAKYELIGGTPMIRETLDIAKSLSLKLQGILIYAAFSYSPKFIPQTFKEFNHFGIDNIFVVPMYPHYSITTYQSVKDYSEDAAKIYGIKTAFAPCSYDNKNYIQNWVNLIKSDIYFNCINDAHLIFSGSSIPMSFIRKGDTYPQQIAISAKLIANKLGMEYSVSYHAQKNGQEWLGPKTERTMEELRSRGVENIILVPISTVNENIETLYDLDRIIVPYARNRLRFRKVIRVTLPTYTLKYIKYLTDLCTDFVYRNEEIGL